MERKPPQPNPIPFLTLQQELSMIFAQHEDVILALEAVRLRVEREQPESRFLALATTSAEQTRHWLGDAIFGVRELPAEQEEPAQEG